MAVPPNRPFGWNDGAKRYIAANGRFVSRLDVRHAIDQTLDKNAVTIRNLAQQLRDKKITVDQWHSAMRENVKSVHLFSAAAARGGWAQLSDSDLGLVGGYVGKDYGYLSRWAADLKSGKAPMDGRMLNRAELYAQSGRRTYHLVDDKVQREAGMSEEKNILEDREACDGCIEQSNRGWVPIGRLVPIGNRQCLSHCRCSVEYRKGPDHVPIEGAGPEGEIPVRPKKGQTARVWDIADELQNDFGRMPTRKEVIQKFVAEGGNVSTASTQYSKWKLAQDAGLKPPILPKPVPKPVIPESVKPKAGSSTRRVWDLSDELELKLGRKPTRREVMDAFVAEGGNASTASTQFGRWSKEFDKARGGVVTPTVAKPKPPVDLGLKPELTQAQRDALIEKRLTTLHDDIKAAGKKFDEELDQLRREQSRIHWGDPRLAEVRAKIASLDERKLDAIIDVMQAPEPATIVVKMPTRSTPEFKKKMERGLRSINKIVDKSSLPKPNSRFFTCRAKASARNRSYYTQGSINISGGAKYDTVVHELGHWIEDGRRDILAKTCEYRRQRSVGESPVRLRDLLGKGYDTHEITLRDQWTHPYSGKLYRHFGAEDYASEMLSMGLQDLVKKPGEFLLLDPEYAKFILRLVWGHSKP